MRFSIELPLRKTEGHSSWCSLDGIFLFLLFTVSYQNIFPNVKQMLYCFLNRQYFCSQASWFVLFPSALKAPPYLTLTSIHSWLFGLDATWSLKPLRVLSAAPQGHRTSCLFASLVWFSLGGEGGVSDLYLSVPLMRSRHCSPLNVQWPLIYLLCVMLIHFCLCACV